MLFDEELLESASESPIDAILAACDQTIAKLDMGDLNFFWNEKDLNELMETAAFVEETRLAHNLSIGHSVPDIVMSLKENCKNFHDYLELVKTEVLAVSYELKFSSLRARYKDMLGSSFSYEFTEGDLSRVQTLINELREQLNTVNSLDDAHKQRLLSRLEKLQSELHKRVSDLDRFWGLVGDAGVVVGKLGTDAKPIVDRIRELAGIVWRTQGRASELPSNTNNPLLGENDEEDGE